MNDARWTWHRELSLIHLRLGEPAPHPIRVDTEADRPPEQARFEVEEPRRQRAWKVPQGATEAWLRAPSRDGFLLRVVTEGKSSRTVSFDRSQQVWMDWTLADRPRDGVAERHPRAGERARIRASSRVRVAVDTTSIRKIQGTELPKRFDRLLRPSHATVDSSERRQEIPARLGAVIRPDLWHEWVLSPAQDDVVGPALRFWKPPAGARLEASFRPGRGGRTAPTVVLEARGVPGFDAPPKGSWPVRIVHQRYQGDTQPVVETVSMPLSQWPKLLTNLSIYDRLAIEAPPGIPVLAESVDTEGRRIALPEPAIRYLGELGGRQPYHQIDAWYPQVLADARDETSLEARLDLDEFDRGKLSSPLFVRGRALYYALRRALLVEGASGDEDRLHEALRQLAAVPLVVLDRLLALLADEGRRKVLFDTLDIDRAIEAVPLLQADPAAVLNPDGASGD